ncbi:DedA family protein [Gordonia hankookensis]|uniref:DedA family protein n=1 Tax=Gordonia hankookensis TaxID=589403 RepID=A0ABR7WAU2_9ACTN|nr:DedA family protein [Gordonia hankookensis]MBD1319925.1 DedA family protein [Gordonia hankookensis]NDZ94482.1 DedA family protein [Streptomyces sp. SID11726]NEB24570.1 DedA family protein [Streptomyces sp. SID6673]
MHVIADWLVELVESVPSWAVYLVTCAVVYAETSTLILGLILPSEATLLAAGVAAAVGPTSIGALVVAVCVAAVAGDVTGYWIGHSSGHRVKASRAGRRFGEERWRSAEARIDRDGMVAVATGRWIGYVRTLVPPVAGMTRMRPLRFGIADVIGATTWATTVLLVGYFAGAALGATLLLYATAALIVGAVSWYVWRKVRSRQTD